MKRVDIILEMLKNANISIIVASESFIIDFARNKGFELDHYDANIIYMRYRG